RFFAMAGNDTEFVVPVQRQGTCLDFCNAGERWGFLRQAVDEIINGFRRTLNFYNDSRRRVADCAYELALSGQTINVRTEPNALDDAGNLDLASDGHDSCRDSRPRLSSRAKLDNAGSI